MSKTIEQQAKDFLKSRNHQRGSMLITINEALNGLVDFAKLTQRWIPVEEKLPETYSKVFATIKSSECIWVEEIGFGEGKFHLPGRGDTNFVTHWMYVPEPPSFL